MDSLKFKVDKDYLYGVPLPQSTDTYTPVSHKQLIETISEQLDKHGLEVVSEQYNVAEDGLKMTGYYTLNRSNSEMGLMLGFSNSYDKSLPVKFAVGSSVFICTNGALISEFTFKRKHTGVVHYDMENFIEGAIVQTDDMFLQIEKDFSKLKERALDKRFISELLGRMYIEEGIITSTQLNIIKRELEKPTYPEFKDMNGYNLYQHCTHALKEAHPSFAIKQLVRTHDFIVGNVLS